jgi:flagellar protein FlgJ
MRITRDNLALQSGMKPGTEQDLQHKKLLAACREFEAIFFQQMLKEMRASVPQSDWLNGGNGEDVFRDLLDEEYAKIMSERNNTGLADLLYRQITGQLG